MARAAILDSMVLTVLQLFLSPHTTMPVCVLFSPSRMNLSPPPVSAQMLPPPETFSDFGYALSGMCIYYDTDEMHFNNWFIYLSFFSMYWKLFEGQEPSPFISEHPMFSGYLWNSE